MNKNQPLTTQDISQWIDNDEGLYAWWKLTRQSKREFIKDYHVELVQLIRAKLNQKPSK